MSKFASLTANLLARKGNACPTPITFSDPDSVRLRRVDGMHIVPVSSDLVQDCPSAAANDATGGKIHTISNEQPADPCGLSASFSRKTFDVSFNLKRNRFVRLSLSAALLGRSTHDIVCDALDRWFENLPTDILGDCACVRGNDD